MTTEQAKTIRELQAKLTNIKLGKKCFFNIVEFRDELKLVKEHCGKWALTEKGISFLNVIV
jgi:hypothetical protein